VRFFHLTSITFAAGLLLAGCGGTGSGTALTAPAHIYVGDSGNGRIIRMDDMNGTGWTEKTGAEGGGTAFGTVSLDFAVDSQGRIYVADAGNSRIVRYDSFTSTTPTVFGTQGSGVNQLHWPVGIAIDSQDRIYVADYQNDRIVRINDITGAGWTTFGSNGAGTNQFDGIHGIALDSQGRIYAADAFNDRIVRIDDMTGANWTTLGSSGSGVGQFGSPVALQITPAGKLLVADRSGRVIETGLMSTTGWTEFAENTAQFAYIDGQGKVYTVNQNDDVVHRFNSMTSGSPTLFGTSGSGTNQFNSATWIYAGP